MSTTQSLFLYLGVALTIAVAAGLAWFSGIRAGRRGDSIWKTPLRAWGWASFAGAPILCSTLLFVARQSHQEDQSFMFDLFYFLLIAIILSPLITLIPSAVASFMAYSFGARRRAQEALAALAQAGQDSIPHG